MTNTPPQLFGAIGIAYHRRSGTLLVEIRAHGGISAGGSAAEGSRPAAADVGGGSGLGPARPL